jgi:hypothetical protein
LSGLRQRLEDHITVKRGSASKTFLDYLSEKREEMDQHQARTAVNAAPPNAPSQATYGTAEAPATPAPESSVSELLAAYDALGSKEERLDFLLKLDESEKGEIKNILAERKRKQHEAEELMDLID